MRSLGPRRRDGCEEGIENDEIKVWIASCVNGSRVVSGECRAGCGVLEIQSRKVVTLPESVTCSASMSHREVPLDGAGRELTKARGIDMAGVGG